MKVIKFLFGLGLVLFSFLACQDDVDDNLTQNEQNNQSSNVESIKDFIWKAMNVFYLYKSDAPDLADDRFSSNQDYASFLSRTNSPIEFFNSLLANQDRFSFIVDDFVTLEENLQGISRANGMSFGLVRFSGTNTVFGYVRYVVPGSPADTEGVERGMIFNRVDGELFTPQTNFNRLLSPSNYTIGLAEFQDGNLVSINDEINLNKIQLTENPIHEHKILDVDGKKVGYLMYNNFRTPFDGELNGIFAEFSSQGISDLVLDLRYNSGGNIETCKDLSSMITGQFEGQVFAKQVFNENFDDQNIFFDNEISTGESINSLNLTKVYVLTTNSSASASELLINALNPYIDVVHIGDNTSGKFEGSITLYDSSDFRRRNASLDHTYAIQPLIIKTVNKDGFSDFFDGLVPNIRQRENFANLGVLGDSEETLLNRALQQINPSMQPASSREQKSDLNFEIIGENQMDSPSYQKMYVDPDVL
jgi:C-terminal processing protease CtpA/Prc